jgi:transcriptional regulator with XRE-family HTH domain
VGVGRRRAQRKGAPAAKAEDIKGPLGRRIRELRERAGLSQKEAAHASGISAVFYGTLERGEKAATVETVEKLARGLRVPPHELFRFDSPPGDSDDVERMIQRIAGLARGASPGKIRGFEVIAAVFFGDEDRPPLRMRGPRRRRGR